MFYWLSERICARSEPTRRWRKERAKIAPHLTDHGISTFNKLARARRQSLYIAGYCGIAGIRMDPRAVLRVGFLGRRPGDCVRAAVSAAVEIDAAKTHTCCAGTGYVVAGSSMGLHSAAKSRLKLYT